MITALTASGALVFTGFSLNATQKQVALSEQGQYTDRYTKAVEQLDQTGPERLQTRLGGIYALQRLAADSPRDQPTIVNVLGTFISSTVHRADPAADIRCPDRIAPDIQAAFTVLTTRDHAHDTDTTPPAEGQLDLRGACLARGRFVGADLRGTDLTRATLKWTDLTRARADHADLTEVDLTGATLDGANLSTARLPRAHLGGAQMSETYLVSAKLTGADLRSANLVQADLGSATLTGASFGEAVLIGADPGRADLTAADLSGARLDGADLTGARLHGARLVGASHDGTRVELTTTDHTTTGRWW
ncbi:pentapeptide repeat-containing protein [Saccharothrix texasensis]|uniref:Uncharacterized protein YjbI with pentapeptide repeats n=1 Tax=Saccharothrix texasensis TaxID=103734 RepID=A0A3N1H8J8_9PSEU|nr:pentapeptide repeat-containing protein [Saccharothrix texasensis]ROP38746.1 uncharacterized protein YjbI with pentapeptide repeats [Saccharothrix texasensis]